MSWYSVIYAFGRALATTKNRYTEVRRHGVQPEDPGPKIRRHLTHA